MMFLSFVLLWPPHSPAAAAPAAAPPVTVAAIEAFRGVRWGSAPGADMTKTHEFPNGVEEYARATDRLTIGAAPLEWVSYSYYKRRFYSAIAAFKMENALTLRAALTAVYGAPTAEAGGLAYTWKFGLVSVQLWPAGSTVSWFYAPIFDEVAHIRRETSRDPALDL